MIGAKLIFCKSLRDLRQELLCIYFSSKFNFTLMGPQRRLLFWTFFSTESLFSTFLPNFVVLWGKYCRPAENATFPLVKKFYFLQCNYSTALKQNMKVHMKTHSNEKQYKCNQCTYATAYQHHMKNHLKTHSGEKLFQCEQCNYSALLASSLKIHLRKHSGEKPYDCDQCTYLIIVIFFTRTKFLENKIYTEKCQFFALNL